MQRRSSRVLLVVAAFMLLAVPVGAIAVGPTFSDVPPTDWAYQDVEWLAAAGVTKGCGDGTIFCPDDFVTRRQMAAFMHRLAVNKVVDAKTAMTASYADNADKLDGKDSTAFLGSDAMAADADKLDGYSAEHIVPRAEGIAYYRGSSQPTRYEASVTIFAPASGTIIAHAGGDSYDGTGDQTCALYLNESAGLYMNQGYVDHAQDSEADCSTSGSLVVDAGRYTVDLRLTGDGYQKGVLWAMWVPFNGNGVPPGSGAILGSVELNER